MIKNYNDPRHKPLTWKEHLENERAAQERKREEEQRPIREAEATLNETHRKLFNLQKSEVEAGHRDPAWTMPPSAVGLKMTEAEAKTFVAKEASAYKDDHPEYYPCVKNFETVVNYLLAQGVVIADRNCLAQAVERLRHFGLLEERPAPASESAPVEQSQESIEVTEAPPSELVDGWDIETGEPRKFSQREINQMSSSDYKRAFKMWVTKDEDRCPRFTRGYFQ